MCKKVISFCLYGQKRKYCHGMIESLISANVIYLDWEVWIFYCSSGTLRVPDSIINILKNLNCKLIPYSPMCNHEKTIEGMFHRFEPIANSDIDFFICRDADSRSTPREKNMVEEWVLSGKTVHSILDHACHQSVMGGLFGLNLKNMREKYPEKLKIFDTSSIIPNKQSIYNDDQKWLRNFLEDIIKRKKDIFIHSIEGCVMYGESLPGSYPDNTQIIGRCQPFCGQSFNVNSQRAVSIIKDIEMEGLIE